MANSANIGSSIRLGDQTVTGTVQYQANTETIYSEHPTLDPKWRGTDSNGHEHHYDRGYPTLDYIVDRQHWCDGHEGIYNHDPHWAEDESHYECKDCQEHVKPGMLPANYPQTIVTSREFTVTVTDPVPFAEVEGAIGDMEGRFFPVSQTIEGGFDRQSQKTEFAFSPA